MKISTLIKLGLVGTALVMLPRRSSKDAGCCGKKSGKGDGCPVTDTAEKAEHADKSCNTKTKKGCDCKNCKCPLCRIGKCPLCAMGKCFCCKKSASNAKK